MIDFKELRKILNGSNMSVKHYQNGKVAVTDSSTFRGMSTSKLQEAQELVEKAVKEDTIELAKKCGVKEVDTLDSVMKRAEDNIGTVMDCFRSKKPMTAEEIRAKMTSPASIRDSIINPRWNTNNVVDPARSSLALPNIYISPWEANALYSQKGIFETIINKKSKSFKIIFSHSQLFSLLHTVESLLSLCSRKTVL